MCFLLCTFFLRQGSELRLSLLPPRLLQDPMQAQNPQGSPCSFPSCWVSVTICPSLSLLGPPTDGLIDPEDGTQGFCTCMCSITDTHAHTFTHTDSFTGGFCSSSQRAPVLIPAGILPWLTDSGQHLSCILRQGLYYAALASIPPPLWASASGGDSIADDDTPAPPSPTTAGPPPSPSGCP